MQIIEQHPLAAHENSPSRAREENLFFQLLSFTQDGTQATSYPEGPWLWSIVEIEMHDRILHISEKASSARGT